MRSKNRKKRVQQISNIDRFISKLNQGGMPLDECLSMIDSFKDTFFSNPELEFELLVSNGLPLEIEEDRVYLRTSKTNINDEIFCVVDIETNGSNVNKGQIIEIGAVKMKNGEIIDEYESLVYAKDVPPYIQEVTNITPKMLQDAPVLKTVLEEFKLFLEDDVFVAHDIKFDYKFISDSLMKYDLGKLENRKLCTIDLAKRTIEAQRYGLDFMKNLLSIDIEGHHRAFSDALSTSYILKESLSKVPSSVVTTEALIAYSKSNNIVNPPQEKKKQKEES